jgi:hypothetical protein
LQGIILTCALRCNQSARVVPAQESSLIRKAVLLLGVGGAGVVPPRSHVGGIELLPIQPCYQAKTRLRKRGDQCRRAGCNLAFAVATCALVTVFNVMYSMLVSNLPPFATVKLTCAEQLAFLTLSIAEILNGTDVAVS